MALGYVLSPAWRLSFENGLFVLSAGADHLYGIEDVDEATANELSAAWERGEIELADLSPGARDVAEELIQARVIASTSADEETRAVTLRWVGEPEPRLEHHLLAGIAESRVLCSAQTSADVLLFVRTTGRLVELYESTEPVRTPHLLLDVAYHHTVSLGPLVVSGETACLACLAGRIGALWGDPSPPPRPVVLDSPAFAAALAVRELEKIAAGDVGLANATAAYDLDAHRLAVGSVYKLPWCPVCGDPSAPEGSIDLPWVDAA